MKIRLTLRYIELGVCLASKHRIFYHCLHHLILQQTEALGIALMWSHAWPTFSKSTASLLVYLYAMMLS